MKTRPIEVYRLWTDGTWDTEYYDIPADTPEEDIERVVRDVALGVIEQPCAGVGVYSYAELEDEM